MQPAGNNERPPTASNDHGFCQRDWVVTGDNRVADIFFPASGNYNGTTLNNRGSNGNYWSSTWNSETKARNLNFNSSNVNPQNNNNRRYGFTARAVQHLPEHKTTEASHIDTRNTSEDIRWHTP